MLPQQVGHQAAASGSQPLLPSRPALTRQVHYQLCKKCWRQRSCAVAVKQGKPTAENKWGEGCPGYSKRLGRVAMRISVRSGQISVTRGWVQVPGKKDLPHAELSSNGGALQPQALSSWHLLPVSKAVGDGSHSAIYTPYIEHHLHPALPASQSETPDSYQPP